MTTTLVDNFNETFKFVDAYFKVIQVSGDKNRTQVRYGIFKDAQGKMLQEKIEDFKTDLEGPNSIKQAYEHLKTLAEFASAVDC